MKLETFRHSVLGLCLISEQFCAAASTLLQPRYFEIPVEQHLCRFIIEHFREFRKVPKKLSIADRATKYFSKSARFKEVQEEFYVLLDIVCDMDQEIAEQADYIQSRVVEFCREQAIKDALIKSVESIQKGKLDEVLPAVQQAMYVGSEMEGSGIYFFQDADKRQTVQEVRRCIPTGHVWIDEPTKGGAARGELVIIQAAPNVGKTSALINIGVGVLRNRHKPAHISLEMEQGVVRAKYDQCFLKKTDEDLVLDAPGMQKLASFMKNCRKQLGADLYIKDFPPNRLTIEALKAHLLLLKSRDQFDADVLLLDYMDLMALPTHIKEPHLQYAWLGVELRGLAKALGIAVYTVTQTNRFGSTKETSGGEDVSHDHTKWATSDFMGSLNQTQKEAEENEARLFWFKTRFSGKKFRTYNLSVDWDRTLIQGND